MSDNRWVMNLFHNAAKDVPAYAHFLEVRNVKPASVKKIEDFHQVPITNKKSYLQQYPLNELVWGGKLDSPMLFCATSGSTGTPYYFPRNEQLSWQYSWIIEDFIKQNGGGDKSTLVIIGFGMGIWIGGVITLRAFEIASQRANLPISILPAGYNKTEIFKALRQLAPNFDQTILIGYPPFVKQIIDESTHEAVDISKLHIRTLFAAESFTETFRDYICKRTHANPLLDTLNIYGTADIGAMAYETPVSILIRRLATKNKDLFYSIFGQIEKTPTLAQYNDKFMHFEEVEGEVVLTGNSSMPLIRYSVGDHGGVFSYSKMLKIFHEFGLDLEKECKRAGILHAVKKQPFVFVYERVNFAVTLHGITLYPEFIKEGLLHPDFIPYLSERFTMLTKFDAHQNQYLEINLELQRDAKVTPKLRASVNKIVREKLIEKSSEFAEVSKSRGSKKLIKIVFWPQDHPRYFPGGVKQKWVITE